MVEIDHSALRETLDEFVAAADYPVLPKACRRCDNLANQGLFG